MNDSEKRLTVFFFYIISQDKNPMTQTGLSF